MGGPGSGGKRINSGPKRRDLSAAWLGGSAGKHGPKVIARPETPPNPAPADPVPMPDGLDADTQAVWALLAPHAEQARTLTASAALAFGLLCRNIVMERLLAAAPTTRAGPDHRGMLQRVETGLARFRLIPDGRPVVAVEAPKDEWAEFDTPGPRLVQNG